MNLPACLVPPLTELGLAAARATGTAGVKASLERAVAGELPDAEALALAAEVQALAGLLGGGRMGT